MLHATHRSHRCLLGPYHAQPLGPRGHVLVLFPSRPRCSDLVETIYHDVANRPIRPRSWICIFCFLYLLLQHIFPEITDLRPVRRGGVCGVCGDGNSLELLAALHILLFSNIQKRKCKGRKRQEEGAECQSDCNEGDDRHGQDGGS